MHRCLDEQLVVRLAAGLVPVADAQRLLAEVEACEACRLLLREGAIALRATTLSEPQHPELACAGFRPGEVIAERYQVRRMLGRGGMGEVYEVFDTELQERAALKTIVTELSDDPQMVVRFKQELRLARKIAHPNVCRVFDLGVSHRPEGAPFYYLTMEFIEGRPLSADRGSRVAVPYVLSVARQFAAGLAAIHAHGIIHRDLKPENVVVHGGTIEAPRCTILDFGVARSPDRLSTLETTGTGLRLGTPDYMAPELLRRGSVTQASDVFSFGLVVYELLSGQHPCPDVGSRASLGALGELSIRPITELRADAPPALSDLLARCLRSDPARRPPSGGELVRSLSRMRGAG
ncbi:MAG TPA: serine/threonine-protein kinase [Polyangiaceae bacterium]|nr:serine/threonine-protein kinase [Polyangiaceae bacterium]